MAQPNTSGDTGTGPPEGFVEYLALLAQNPASFSQFSAFLTQSSQSPSLPSTPTPSSSAPAPGGRTFNRSNRGVGGELAEKQRASRDITAPATKRKTLVDCDTKVEFSPTPGTTEVSSGGQAKRLKVSKVSTH